MAGCFALVGQAISALAGQETHVLVETALSVFAEFDLAISIALTGLAAAWAVLERSLRHRKVEYLQDRIRMLETSIDPRRSTSNLTTKGKTNPEDKD